MHISWIWDDSCLASSMLSKLSCFVFSRFMKDILSFSARKVETHSESTEYCSIRLSLHYFPRNLVGRKFKDKNRFTLRMLSYVHLLYDIQLFKYSSYFIFYICLLSTVGSEYFLKKFKKKNTLPLEGIFYFRPFLFQNICWEVWSVFDLWGKTRYKLLSKVQAIDR